MKKDIYKEIVKTLEENGNAVLATLIQRRGSAPREAGAKFLVKEDGSTIGTIGGGSIEAKVLQKAREILEEQRRENQILHFDLKVTQWEQEGSVCGGDENILLEPIDQEFLEIYREILMIKEKGESALLLTLLSVDGDPPKGKGKKTLWKKSGETVGDVSLKEFWDPQLSEKREEFLSKKEPEILEVQLDRKEIPWKQVEILLEPIFSEPTLYIFGAGHISQQLAPLAKKVHFKVVVIDDREMFANRENFPEADELIVTEFEESFKHLSIDPSSYIVIVTRGHLFDGLVLEKALHTTARYIGMIGSKRKIRLLYEHLMKKGFLQEDLRRIHAPIGIDINAETPEEIAVSIIAELIKVRRGRET
ncbi:MAG: XdhC family aldehyde oxidoreductase maturation factor [Thermodesulfobacteriota bacterium]